MVNMSEKKKPLVKRLNVVNEIAMAMAKYHAEALEAVKNGEKICWITGSIPTEVLSAMDIWCFVLEAHASIAAGWPGFETWPYQMAAEKDGYSIDLCPYAREIIGEHILKRPDGYPPGTSGGMPPPDFLLAYRQICGPHAYWCAQMQRMFNVPLFMFDTMLYNRPVEDHDKKRYAAGLRDMIKFIEGVTGKKLDPDRLEEAYEISGQAAALVDKILELNKNIPAPFDEMDFMATLLALSWWRGRKESPYNVVEIFEGALKEVEDRVKNKISAIEDERVRLVFDSNPPWYRYYWIADYLAERGAVYVTSTLNRYMTYYNGFNYGWCNVGRGWSFEEIGAGTIPNWLSAGLEERIKYICKLAKDYRADAAIIMDNSGCKPISLGLYDEGIALEEMGVPCMFFDGNQADPRYFNEDIFKDKVDAFLEMVEANKKSKGGGKWI